MGKDLRGRNLERGITQTKDGRYFARFTSKSGKRQAKRFDNYQEARRWLRDARYEDEHSVDTAFSQMTVDSWYDYWLRELKCDLAPNTRRNYRERYEKNVKPLIGHMPIGSVRQMHCKEVLNRMSDCYAGSTIKQTYITMGTLFKAAKVNGIIEHHPMDGLTFHKPVKAVDDIRYLTLEEQQRFLQIARSTHNGDQYALILQTGLRTGEMIALTWKDINWEKRELTVDKTLEYRYTNQCWRAGPPKSLHGYRTIPLTSEAYTILHTLYEHRRERKESPVLDQWLEYEDRRSGEMKRFYLRDLVFINFRTGEPTKNSSYDTHLYKLCEKAGIEKFSMHALRHTFATRMIERGVQPKALQKILGHSSLKMTMDRYVHVTDDSMLLAMNQFEQAEYVGMKQ